MFEKAKYVNAIGFGLVQGKERLENGGDTISQEVYDDSTNALLAPEIVAHAVMSMKALRQHYGKIAAPYLAAGFQFAMQYWIYEPFMELMPEKKQRALLMNCAMTFAVAQSGIGPGWEDHAREMLAAAKDAVAKSLSESV